MDYGDMDYDDMNYGDYDEGDYGDMGGGGVEKIPGLLSLDDVSFRKLLSTGKTIIVNIVEETWSPDSERLKFVAKEFKDNDDIFLAKIAASENNELMERLSVKTSELRIFKKDYPSILVSETEGSDAITFIRSSTDKTISSFFDRLKGFLTLDLKSQSRVLAEVESLVNDESSEISKKIHNFLIVTWKRADGDVKKVEAEKVRLENLLEQNVDSISKEKVVEFRIRLRLLKVLHGE